MAETFYTLLTKAGQGELANATTFGTKVNFTKFKVGDGNGSYYEPTETQTDLVNTVWTGNVQSVRIDDNNSNWIVIEAIIPTSEGGFTIREMGIYDDQNNLLAISKCAETYKPVITDGSTKELWMKMVLVVTNTSVVNLKIDPSIIFATKQDLKNLEIKIEGELDDFNFQTAGGTATAIILKVNQTLENGLPLNFVASFDNNGQATTVNGKPLYKPNTTVSPKLKTGKGYTIWYNSTKDCFFIKASAEGTATKECVLAGYTFSSDDDVDMEGIIVNNGALNNANFPINGTYTIPAGYTSGGTITQNIPVKNAQTYIPTTTDQTIPLGQYLKGNQIIKGDANLVSSKIVSPYSIFGVQGTATIESLGGYKLISGTATVGYIEATSVPSVGGVFICYIKVPELSVYNKIMMFKADGILNYDGTVTTGSGTEPLQGTLDVNCEHISLGKMHGSTANLGVLEGDSLCSQEGSPLYPGDGCVFNFNINKILVKRFKIGNATYNFNNTNNVDIQWHALVQ